ncbi:uncharacterized protein A4U43_C02F1990 [Asparagus officinalis]|uniref:HMA domain-containing protein n=1 Tax=Asparagus officinalis TaxID=4686 RepID=A0A5P1FJZ4_ASPOF|nr:protein SODIUM POTASSIUM ROOT DEFECTIVE 1-like [Asparagus officinalis]ONK76991.1 uncharacterized protein A4U43_C02F1990 [Asparagus officinalis]
MLISLLTVSASFCLSSEKIALLLLSLSQSSLFSLSWLPSLFKEMKGVNFSCVSPASAAVCTSIDRRSMVRPTIIGRSSSTGRHLRTKSVSQLPKPAGSKPKSYNTEKFRKSLDYRHSDLKSPADSSRYLLDDTTFIDMYPEFEPKSSSLTVFDHDKVLARSPICTGTPRLFRPMKENEASSTLVRSSSARTHQNKALAQSLVKKDDTSTSSAPRPSNSTKSHHDQVVVLRVSLHCKGCEGKVRKHISKMEGVTSFNIDFATKKVTVKGDITPLGVLNSVSKVKNAQFWPSGPSSA